VQPGRGERLARLHAARNALAERAVGLERDDGRIRRVPVLRLQRRLQFLELFGVHAEIILVVVRLESPELQRTQLLMKQAPCEAVLENYWGMARRKSICGRRWMLLDWIGPLNFGRYPHLHFSQERGCIGGHFTEPYEQKTQQSPGFGRRRVLHDTHS
jgi:hypothetical protein